MKAAVQELPAMAGIELANWNWKVVHQFVSERFGISLSRSGCLNYLHRLGFAFKHPKKRLVKADERKRESFVAEYAGLTEEARRSGARIFFAVYSSFSRSVSSTRLIGMFRSLGLAKSSPMFTILTPRPWNSFFL